MKVRDVFLEFFRSDLLFVYLVFINNIFKDRVDDNFMIYFFNLIDLEMLYVLFMWFFFFVYKSYLGKG